MADCQHHWRIEPPEGPTSPGRCIFCDAEREFKNTAPWPYGKLSKTEHLEMQKQLLAAVLQAGADDGEYVT